MFPRLIFAAPTCLRPTLLGGVCMLGLMGGPLTAAARDIVPEKPSVEVNLDAIKGLRAVSPAIQYVPTPTPAPAARSTPMEQPAVTPSVPPASLPPASALEQRRIPTEQPVPGYQPPRLNGLPQTAPLPAAVEPLPVSTPEKRSRKQRRTKVRDIVPAAPAVDLPAPVSAPVPMKPTPPPAPIAREEVTNKPPVKPVAAVPVAPPSLPSAVLPTKSAAGIAAPASAPAPAPIPVLAPVVKTNTNLPPAPDISKLDFSNFPTQNAPTPAPVPLKNAKPSDTLPPLAAPTTPKLSPIAMPNGKTSAVLVPSIPATAASPMMVPVPKELPPLPPSVDKRMGEMFGKQPEKQGILSDKTRVEDASTLLKKQAEADAAAKKAAEANAAAAKPVKPPVAPALEIKNDWVPAANPPSLPKPMEKLPPAELPPAPKTPEAASAPTPLTPITLPKSEIAPPPKLEAKPAPAPVGNAAVTPSAPPLLPPQKEGMPAPLALPKLPGTETLVKPPAPKLPPLTAITGEAPKSAMDLTQPKDAIDAKPLPSPLTPLTPPPALARMGGGEVDGAPIVKRELPEVNVGAPPALPPMPKLDTPVVVTTPAAPKSPAAPASVAAPAKPAPVAPVVTPPAVTPPAPPPVTAPALSGADAKLTRTLSFAKEKTDLSDDAKSDLNDVAEKVKASKGNVRIVAYASGTAEQASVARRVSLSRALAIRAFLISKGVNQLDINVQALGNQIPSGEGDRADIFTK